VDGMVAANNAGQVSCRLKHWAAPMSVTQWDSQWDLLVVVLVGKGQAGWA